MWPINKKDATRHFTRGRTSLQVNYLGYQSRKFAGETALNAQLTHVRGVNSLNRRVALDQELKIAARLGVTNVYRMKNPSRRSRRPSSPSEKPPNANTQRHNENTKAGKRLRGESGDSSQNIGVPENAITTAKIVVLLEHGTPAITLEI